MTVITIIITHAVPFEWPKRFHCSAGRKIHCVGICVYAVAITTAYRQIWIPFPPHCLKFRPDTKRIAPSRENQRLGGHGVGYGVWEMWKPPLPPPPHYLSRVVYSNVFGKLTVRVFRENIFETQSGLTWFDDNFDLFFFYKQAFCPKTSTHSCIVSGGEFRLFGGFKTPFFDLPISVLTRPNTNRREMTTKRQTRDFVSLESYYFFVIPKTIVLDTCNFHTKCNAVAYQRAKKRCTF